jgi:hypothetical protein
VSVVLAVICGIFFLLSAVVVFLLLMVMLLIRLRCIERRVRSVICGESGVVRCEVDQLFSYPLGWFRDVRFMGVV